MSVGVQPGGVLNSYRVRYSPETHQLLKVLMDEVKMTTLQRQELNDSMKKGEPLPLIRQRRMVPSFVDENLFDLKRNYYFMKRSQDQIIDSGAYERDRYRSLKPTVDIEKEKERLGSIMAYGKVLKAPTGVKKQPRKKEPPKFVDKEERVNELVQEIRERLEFLQDMDALGQRHNYDTQIKQEIASKLREMKNLNSETVKEWNDILEAPKKLPSKIQELLRWDT